MNGWTFWQVVMMYALIFVTEGVGSLFFEGTWRVSYLVYSGQFDQVLLRPVSPIVQVLAGAVGFNGLGNIVSGGVLIEISMANAPVRWTPGRLLFRDPARERIDNSHRHQPRLGRQRLLGKTPWSIIPLFVHQLGDFAKYPITIYSVGVQALIVVAIPFAFVSFFPTAYVFGVEAWSAAGLLTPLVAIYCMVMAALLFRFGLRHYESTGH